MGLKRWYEWRKDNGDVHLRVLAENGCAAWCSMWEEPTTVPADRPPTPGRDRFSIYLYVSATGESLKCERRVSPGLTVARLADWPEARWFDGEGRPYA